MKEKEIRALLENAYDREQWKQLVTALFPGRDVFARPVEHEATTVQGRRQVQRMLQFGDVQLADGNVVGLFEVEVAPGVDLTRNRVAIRKAMEQPVKQSGHSGALIAFVDKQQGLWRFSFYSNTLKDDGTWDANTPKRYTYLLGQGEQCLTAARQFDALAQKAGRSTLADLLEAFSVEKVGKAFFREYKEHYQDLVQHLTGKRMVKRAGKWEEKVMHQPSPKLATYFNGSEKDARDFCKKLMGRLVFLYFLQKKRWLGATTTAYTDGDTDFVYRLFRATGGEGFYPTVLTSLFFETLNTERANDDYRMPDGSTRKVPFLNGGLFDKDALDRKTQLLTFPPELFSKPASADDEKDRGFLDFLNAYNFTVHEAGPEEQTLAVDPEMLGHIFENLLEDNKDKGAFYTPKEIVHYMCQESLTQYLKNYLQRHVAGTLPADLEDHLRTFLKDGTGAPLSAYSGLLLKALHDVKVCDPAIGSGAFPMGILHEVFQAVYHLQEFSPDEFSSIWGLEHWEPAEVKLRIIQHSIYGVDIERGAVDIARLRFWLSIIVDEPRPRTLPNLDYKIVVGDSLLGKFNGEVLKIDWDLKGTTDRVNEVRGAIDALHAKTELYFRDQPPAKKFKLEQEIRALKIELLTKQLELNRDKFKAHMISVGRIGELTKKEMLKATEQKMQLAAYEETLGKLRVLAKQKDKALDYFDWQLDFPEILNRQVNTDPGFDVVIGNPPYYVLEGNKKSNLEDLKNDSRYESAQSGKLNAYKVFMALAPFIQKRSNGVLCYIFQNSFLGDQSADKLRLQFLESQTILQIDSFPERDNVHKRVFESAKMSVCIFFSQNSTPIDGHRFNLTVWNDRLQDKRFTTTWSRGEIETIDSELLAIPMVSEAEKQIMLAIHANAPSRFSQHFECYRGELNMTTERKYFTSVKNPHMALKGAQIQQYRVRLDQMSQGEIEYVLKEKYLSERKSDKAGHYSQDRVVTQRITGVDEALRLKAATIGAGTFCADSCNYLMTKNEALPLNAIVGLLNSRLLNWRFKATSTNSNVNGYEVDALPIPSSIPDSVVSKITDLVRKMSTVLEGPRSRDLQSTLDHLIYRLYRLSYEQAKVVDPELGLSKEAYEALELPEAEGPTGQVAKEPGFTGLMDEGTLFGQPVEEERSDDQTIRRSDNGNAGKAKAGVKSPSAAASNGQAPAAILAYLQANTGWHGKGAILHATGVDTGAWNAAIKELLEAGKVERQGEKKGARYRVK